MTWWQALIDAGAVPAAFVPSPGSFPSPADPEQPHVEIIEGETVEALPVPSREKAWMPPAVSFLAGFQRWNIVACDGIVQIADAHVAAAVRRRDRRGVLRTVAERTRGFAVAAVSRMTPAVRQRLEHDAPDIEPLDGALVEQPARYLERVEAAVRRARAALERELVDACLPALDEQEWLVIDGLLSRSPSVARHPRALGVIRSHGAQLLEGTGVERALTLPAGHRTSVFTVQGGHTRAEVYSWYLRLWPWEGNDLLYGLLRIEARPDRDVVRRASELSGWIWAERAPLATPAARWDRLLYPLHSVEEYLRARAPRDLSLPRASRIPRTGT